MYLTRALTLGAVGASLVAGLFVMPAGAAQAATPAGIASIGSATVTIAGHANLLAAVAQCNVNGRPINSTAGPSIPGIVSFGPGHSSCVRNHTTGTTMATAAGTRFQLDALASYGGPRIVIDRFQVTCRADAASAKAAWSFGSLTGLGHLPRNIPENYTVQITGRGGRVVATAILNEVKQSSYGRGVSLNLLHILLFPDGGPIGGDVIVGRTTCTPSYY